MKEEDGCAGSKDIVIAIDASKSVTSKGWSAEISFAVRLVQEITENGNPNGHRLNLHWFNAETRPIGQVGGDNSPGMFSTDGSPLVAALKRLNYDSVKDKSTDHPQVYETSEKAFKSPSARAEAPKVLVLITDGETHKGNRCKQLTSNKGDMEAKIGKCSRNSNHVCSSRGCDAAKCLCGLYAAELFKAKGYELVIVGIANRHHNTDTQDGVFDKIMERSASPGKAYVAETFEDLDDIVVPLVKNLCKQFLGYIVPKM